MEHAVFRQRVLRHFKVELGKCFLLGLEWYLGGMHALHPHDGYALRKNAELPRSAIREVDDASASVRTRSVTRTITCLPLRSLVTRSSVPKG